MINGKYELSCATKMWNLSGSMTAITLLTSR